MVVLSQHTNTQATFQECDLCHECWDTWVEEYTFDALKNSQVKQLFPKSIMKGLTDGSKARYAFLVVHWNDSPPSLASTIFRISSGSLKLPRRFLILYCISTMGIAAAKASPHEDDCLLFIYKACIREDEVPVRCITYCRTDGTCDLGDWIFVYTPSAEHNIRSKVLCTKCYSVLILLQGSVEEPINLLLPLYRPLDVL